MRIGVPTFETRSRFQHFITGHVRQVDVEKDDVVVVELAEIDAFFAQVSRIDVEPFRLEHQLDALGRRGIILDQQHSHANPLSILSRNSARPHFKPCAAGRRALRNINCER
jgi:hypothetical protein